MGAITISLLSTVSLFLWLLEVLWAAEPIPPHMPLMMVGNAGYALWAVIHVCRLHSADDAEPAEGETWHDQDDC